MTAIAGRRRTAGGHFVDGDDRADVYRRPAMKMRMKTNTRIAWLWGAGAFLLAFTVMAGGIATPGDALTDLKAALDRAIDDERHAIAFYERVIREHGERRPFSNIVHAERRHESALLSEYERLGLTPPPDRWAGRALTVPTTFRGACDAAEFAEIENVRMYDELIAAVDDEQLCWVLRRLQWASAERHLPAFRRHSSGWQLLSETPTPAQAAQADRAAAARADLFSALLERL
ncbi:MAG: ferritin-like domain-containing protein, partial [Planctomycetota bacterium]